MTPKEIKHAFDNIDTMLEKADVQQVGNYAMNQAIGALILAVSNLRDVVKEMYESKVAEEGVTNASTI